MVEKESIRAVMVEKESIRGVMVEKGESGTGHLLPGVGEGWMGGGGVACEVLPLQKGGMEKVLAMLKGGGTSFGVMW